MGKCLEKDVSELDKPVTDFHKNASLNCILGNSVSKNLYELRVSLYEISESGSSCAYFIEEIFPMLTDDFFSTSEVDEFLRKYNELKEKF